MMPPFNVLITSISRKIPLIKAVQNAFNSLNLKGVVIGADTNPACIGRYFVDQFWEMPSHHQLSLKDLSAFCQQHHIKAIIPTRDGELPFFAEHKQALRLLGIECLVSDQAAIEICGNKMHFAEFLQQNHFPSIPTFTSLEAFKRFIHNDSQLVIKEQFSGISKEVKLKLSLEEAKHWATQFSHPLYQPYIEGEEFSVDLYVDHTRTVKGPIVRQRNLVINGESQITTSIKNARVEKLCTDMALALKLYGHAVFQIIQQRDSNQLYVVECNPRFGGASTLSIAMGLCSFEWFFLETLDLPLHAFNRSLEEKRQIRYPTDLIIPH